MYSSVCYGDGKIGEMTVTEVKEVNQFDRLTI